MTTPVDDIPQWAWDKAYDLAGHTAQPLKTITAFAAYIAEAAQVFAAYIAEHEDDYERGFRDGACAR